jgi:hypothetical protein
VLPLISVANVNSSVNLPPKITSQNPQVTWAYFVDSKEARKKLEVTNSRDHNQPVIARTPHPQSRRACPELVEGDDSLVAQHEVLGEQTSFARESRRDEPAATAIGAFLRNSMDMTRTRTQDWRPGLPAPRRSATWRRFRPTTYRRRPTTGSYPSSSALIRTWISPASSAAPGAQQLRTIGVWQTIEAKASIAYFAHAPQDQVPENVCEHHPHCSIEEHEWNGHRRCGVRSDEDTHIGQRRGRPLPKVDPHLE